MSIFVLSTIISYQDSEKGSITTRQLVSHTSGIRHYTKKGEKDDDDEPSKYEVRNLVSCLVMAFWIILVAVVTADFVSFT